MQIDLTGKKAIVTGSSDGIGLAIAIGLARAGASLVLVGREQSRIDAALASLKAASGCDTAVAVVADAGTAEGCKQLIAA